MKTITGLPATPRRADPVSTGLPCDRHSLAIILLHWSSALAVLIAVGAVLLREVVEAPAWRGWLMDCHRQAGLYVLLALGLRIAVRLGGGLREVAGEMPRRVRQAACAAHLALYAALLALPLLGWAASNAHGVSLSLFGVLPLNELVADDPDLADTLTDWHAWAAWALGGLLLAHVAAAGWHHAVRRDGVLAAMLPLLKRGTR